MKATTDTKEPTLPGSELSISKMPGHWLLARLGKRVLRPGGRELTNRLLKRLNIAADDDVVELAPGLGVTAKLILDIAPKSYRGVEKNEDAANFARKAIDNKGEIAVGNAESTGLDDSCASVVIGEAMLTMQSTSHKKGIIEEALRLLRPGGRYGVHEIAVVGDGDCEQVEKDISTALSSSIHVGARPLCEKSWRTLFEEAGFTDIQVDYAPMHLLEPRRVVADEGLGRAAMIALKLLSNSEARARVLSMKRTFNRYEDQMKAIAIVATKPVS